MAKEKIVHFTHLYHPSRGGTQSLCQEHSEALVRRGNNIEVYTSNAISIEHVPSYNSQPRNEIINDVPIVRFRIHNKLRRLLLNSLVRYRIGRFINQKTFRRSQEMWKHGPFIPQALLYMLKFRPALINSYTNYYSNTYISYLLHKKFNIPFILSPGTHVVEKWTKSHWIEKIYSSANLVIANTEFEKGFIVSNMNIAPDRVETVSNTIDPKPFFSADVGEFRSKHGLGGQKIVTFLGRQTALKGLTLIMHALELASENIKPVTLVIAGTEVASEAASISGHKKRLTEIDNIKVLDLGEISETEKVNLLKDSDIFIMPSTIDSFGLVYLEAWACETPVVACRNTPQESFIDHEIDGLLISANDAEDLADNLVKILDRGDLLKKMGQNGRKKLISKFTTKRAAEKLESLYARILYS